MADIVSLPDNGSNNGFNIPVSIPLWNNGYGNGMFGGSGFWGAGIGAFLGSALGGGLFNGGGGYGGGNAAAMAALGAQATANNNTELLRAAISSNGEQSRQAIQTVSTMLGQDFATVSSQFAAINGILNNMAIQNATTPLQIVNAIVSGNKDLASQFASCCCENKLLITSQGYENQLATLNQTNQLGNAINGSGQRTVDAIADLKTTMVKEFCDVKEREMQDKINTQAEIITQLRNAADNAAQTNQIIGYVSSVINPLQREVDKIRENQPNTVPVQWPQITAVNTTPYMGGLYGNNLFGGWGSLLGSGLGFGGF